MKKLISVLAVCSVCLIPVTNFAETTDQPAPSAAPKPEMEKPKYKRMKPAEATENKVSKSKAKATSKKVAQKPLVPFDTNIETLPVNFLGHDLKRIYVALSKSEDTFKKSEYESTDKYNARLIDLKNKILLDNFTYGDTYVYVHKKNWSNKYDADNGALKVSLNFDTYYKFFGDGNVLDDNSKMRFEAFTISENKSKYVGSNSYGASTTIRRTESVEGAFAIANWWLLKRILSIDSYMRHVDFDFKVSPEKAASLKENGAWLFVYKLDHPYILETREYHTPTINEPYDSNTIIKNINAEVLEMWFFDSSTGEVIKKIKIK